jgi:hypothetical protein
MFARGQNHRLGAMGDGMSLMQLKRLIARWHPVGTRLRD